MASETRLQNRRAIEALRSGVPNRDAVRSLGAAQDVIEEHFLAQLDAVRAGGYPRGTVLSGDFGSGKSHLLEYVRHLALDQRFVASKVVISKETPLHDPAKVFRAAIADASLPDRRGAALPEIAEHLSFESESYRELKCWAASDESELDARFPATLHLYEHLRAGDPDFAQRVVRFWAGDPLGVGELNRGLRDVGAAGEYAIGALPARELAVQRFRFAARMMQAVGYGGWVLLFDEIELIGRYSLLQRARSYPEIWRWTAGLREERLSGIGAVMAVTSDFHRAVIRDKNDEELVPAKLRARDDQLLALRAELAMREIEVESLQIRHPDAAVRDEIYRRLREIHGAAYDWEPPEIPHGAGVRSTREYVRAWIYEWDLRRLDPSYVPHIEFDVGVSSNYEEDAELETPMEGAELEDVL